MKWKGSERCGDMQLQEEGSPNQELLLFYIQRANRNKMAQVELSRSFPSNWTPHRAYSTLSCLLYFTPFRGGWWTDKKKEPRLIEPPSFTVLCCIFNKWQTALAGTTTVTSLLTRILWINGICWEKKMESKFEPNTVGEEKLGSLYYTQTLIPVEKTIS